MSIHWIYIFLQKHCILKLSTHFPQPNGPRFALIYTCMKAEYCLSLHYQDSFQWRLKTKLFMCCNMITVVLCPVLHPSEYCLRMSDNPACICPSIHLDRSSKMLFLLLPNIISFSPKVLNLVNTQKVLFCPQCFQ